MNWKLDQNVVSQTFGSYSGNTLSADTTTSTGQIGYLNSGWAQYSTIQLKASAASTLNAGDVIQIAGIYATNPQNRQAYGSGKLRNFVVKAINGNSVTVSPAVISAGQFQNVSITSPGASAVTPYNQAGAVSFFLSNFNFDFLYHLSPKSFTGS